MSMHSLSKNIKAILTVAFLMSFTLPAFSQSPKKLLENGYYEQAYVDAVYKQNKKVKLKSKFTDLCETHRNDRVRQNRLVTELQSVDQSYII
jgi:hypothetical protein